MHLGLDDVDRALARVAQTVGTVALQVVQCNRGGDDGVHDALGDLALRALGVGVQDGRVGHQVADIAQEHQRAAVQAHFALAAGRGVDAVGVEAARQGLAALGKRLGQRALQDAQPVGVAQHLVVGVHGGHRVFEVEDGRERRLDHQVRHAGRVAGADRGGAVDHDVDVQTVVLQQHRGRRRCVALVADELRRVLQAGAGAAPQRGDELAAFDAVAGRVLVRTAGQRRCLVEEVARKGDDLGAAFFVVARALVAAVGLGDRVRAVERVVQAAPARVGRVERIACVQDGHHELRAGLHGQLVIDVGGRGLHVAGHGHEVADGFEEFAVGRHVGDRAGVGPVPGVQLGLQAVALGQQGKVARRQVGDDGVKALPEGGAVHARAGQDLLFNEAVQDGGYLQAVDGGACGHGQTLKRWTTETADAPQGRQVPLYSNCLRP